MASESEMGMQSSQTDDMDRSTTRIDSDGFERRGTVRTGERSPDGAPANPELSGKDTHWLIAGSFGAVVLLALAALAVFGFWIGLVVLVLGTMLAVVVNPAVWAAALRSREREAASDR